MQDLSLKLANSAEHGYFELACKSSAVIYTNNQTNRSPLAASLSSGLALGLAIGLGTDRSTKIFHTCCLWQGIICDIHSFRSWERKNITSTQKVVVKIRFFFGITGRRGAHFLVRSAGRAQDV